MDQGLPDGTKPVIRASIAALHPPDAEPIGEARQQANRNIFMNTESLVTPASQFPTLHKTVQLNDLESLNRRSRSF